MRSLVSRRRLFAAAPWLLLLAFAPLALRGASEARAAENERQFVNPADQRNEMIKLLRSIDERLKRFEEKLEKK